MNPAQLSEVFKNKGSVSRFLGMIPEENIKEWEKKNLPENETIKGLQQKRDTLRWIDPAIMFSCMFICTLLIDVIYTTCLLFIKNKETFLAFLVSGICFLGITLCMSFVKWNRKNEEKLRSIQGIDSLLRKFLESAQGFCVIPEGYPFTSLDFREYVKASIESEPVTVFCGTIGIRDWLCCFAFLNVRAEKEFEVVRLQPRPKGFTAEILFAANKADHYREKFRDLWRSALEFGLVEEGGIREIYAKAKFILDATSQSQTPAA